jgi:hypothetical protein
MYECITVATRREEDEFWLGEGEFDEMVWDNIGSRPSTGTSSTEAPVLQSLSHWEVINIFNRMKSIAPSSPACWGLVYDTNSSDDTISIFHLKRYSDLVKIQNGISAYLSYYTM